MIMLRNAKVSDLPVIQAIGTVTYGPTYVPLLGQEQVDYMLEKFYSISALTQQMMEGHIFLIAEAEGKDIGFASYSRYDGLAHPAVKLHKLYVLPSAHGMGLGKFLLNEVRDKAVAMAAEGLVLNVNRENKALNFYEKAGFKIIKTEDIEIGNGFYMNDYVLELPLKKD